MDPRDPIATGRASLSVLVAAVLGVLASPVAAGEALPGPPLAEVRAAADAIDRLVIADLERHGLVPNPPADDDTFVRRVYLDVVGRVPSLAELEAFDASSGPDKRGALVDRLLASPGHTSHAFNWWADLLRVKTKLTKSTSGEPYMDFLKQAIEANRPYDDVVRELLTASGPAHGRDNGATGYLLRDRGMPEDNMANTARVFLGTRLECAQCHDHPFEPWTQKQFFEMTAFTGGLEYVHRSDALAQDRRQLRDVRERIEEEHGAQAARMVRRVARPVAAGISGSGTGVVKLPHDYPYDDAEPEELVQARPIFGEPVDLARAEPADDQDRPRRRRQRERRRKPSRPPEIGSREVYADWLTSPDNPRFTTVIANRMWKRAMGRGLIEPVDDLRDDTQASNPELMAHLERLMVALDYDLLQFERILLNTATYQARASGAAPPPDEPHRFEGPLLRRMTAEQIWDSMLTLVLDDVDAGLGDRSAVEEVFAEYEELVDLDEEQFVERVSERALRRTDPEAYREQRAAERAEQREARRAAGPLRRELGRARRRGDEAAEADVLARMAEMGFDPDRRRSSADKRLQRASELPSPAPAGHFLWRFGQSDREQIEAAHTEANVPQVLSLLNGFVEEHLLARDQAALRRALRDAGSASERVETAYRAILGRPPGEAELALWEDDARRKGAEAYRDLVWTLLNTHEFLFVQ